MGRRLWWPLMWSQFELEDSHIAYFDDEETANAMALLFNSTGLSASVALPVHLSIFQTFIPGDT